MSMRTGNGFFKLLAFFVFAMFASLSARADFSGAYAPANWTTTLAGIPAGGGGTVDTSGAPASITLNGGDAGCSSGNGTCTLQYTITAPGSGPLTFDWNYSTTDVDGPGLDLFLAINGVATVQLSDSGGANIQNGSVNTTVTAGNTIGVMINCTDCIEGAANVTISNFTGPVVSSPASIPTLSEWGMIILSSLLALGTVLALRRRS